MKLEDIKTRTKDAVDYLVQSLESGHSEVLTQYLGAMARFHIRAIARDYADNPASTLVVSPDNASRRQLNDAIRLELHSTIAARRSAAARWLWI
jgi:hypothetical protein